MMAYTYVCSFYIDKTIPALEIMPCVAGGFTNIRMNTQIQNDYQSTEKIVLGWNQIHEMLQNVRKQVRLLFLSISRLFV